MLTIGIFDPLGVWHSLPAVHVRRFSKSVIVARDEGGDVGTDPIEMNPVDMASLLLPFDSVR